MQTTSFKGALFDLDGLLLNSESIYNKAISIVLEEYGHTYTTEIHAQVIGRGGVDGILNRLMFN